LPTIARIHVAREAGPEPGRTHVVEEDERPHHLVGGVGQDAAHLEPAEVLAPLVDDELDQFACSR